MIDWRQLAQNEPYLIGGLIFIAGSTRSIGGPLRPRLGQAPTTPPRTGVAVLIIAVIFYLAGRITARQSRGAVL